MGGGGLCLLRHTAFVGSKIPLVGTRLVSLTGALAAAAPRRLSQKTGWQLGDTARDTRLLARPLALSELWHYSAGKQTVKGGKQFDGGLARLIQYRESQACSKLQLLLYPPNARDALECELVSCG